MRFGLKSLLTVAAIVVLAAAVLVPIAGASGMMGGSTNSSWPTMMPTPTPSPTPSSTLVPGGWCGGGMWGGSGAWGGTGMWGMGSGTGWLTQNPAALQAWLQLRADHVKALRTWQATYKADLTSPAAQQALHDLWTTFWNDMKSFYQQHGNGAAVDLPHLRHVGRLADGRHDGRLLLEREPHVGRGLRRRLDDEPSRRLRPVAHHARQAGGRDAQLAAALRHQPERAPRRRPLCRPLWCTIVRR